MNAAANNRPDADLHYSMGRQRKAQQDFAAAEIAYRAAIECRPSFYEAWISLGILLKQLGRAAEAEDCQRAAIGIDPDNHLGHVNLGNALLLRGASREAALSFQRAADLNPACAEAHNNLGHILLGAKKRAVAATHFNAALAARPDYFEAAAGLGEALVDDDRYAPAIAPLMLANSLRPDHAEVRILLGRALGGIGEFASAAAQFEEVLRRNPERRAAIYGLATSLAYAGQYSRPRKLLQDAVEAAPQDQFTRFAYASLLLRAGEFALGWEHYDARAAFETRPLPQHPQPRWRGESLAGRTLLVTREQGLGDEIMFASLFGELVGMARHCIIECDARLVPLYRRSFPRATFIGITAGDTTRAPAPPFDCWSQLGDLARHLRRNAGDFPRHGGYLLADPARVETWRDLLERRFGKGPRIGIGWRGGVARTRASERSLTLEQLMPVLASSPAGFVSVQYGPCSDELSAFRARSGVDLEHWQAAIDDLDEYAALIAALDLTISVCSAAVHLAGALGKPAWALAPFVPEWRYGHAGSSMIWYPSVRILRQPRAGQWAPVIAEVKRSLRRLRDQPMLSTCA